LLIDGVKCCFDFIQAQQDAEILKSVVLPLEQEIEALKLKVKMQDDDLKMLARQKLQVTTYKNIGNCYEITGNNYENKGNTNGNTGNNYENTGNTNGNTGSNYETTGNTNGNTGNNYEHTSNTYFYIQVNC